MAPVPSPSAATARPSAPKPGARFWSLTFSTAEEAKKTIRECAVGFYAIAGIQAGIGLFLGGELAVDMVASAFLFAALALWLHRRNSKVAAISLVVLAAVTLGVTAFNQFGAGAGGRNIVLSFIVLWVGIKAFAATKKLERAGESVKLPVE